MQLSFTASLDDFEAELDDFESSFKAQLVEYQREISRFVYSLTALKTPKDTGHARSSWQVSLNEDSAEDKEMDVGAAFSVINRIRPFDTLYIFNNTEYILVLELGLFNPPDPGPSRDPRPGRKGKILVEGGFSTQAPNGMLEVTLEAAEAVFNG